MAEIKFRFEDLTMNEKALDFVSLSYGRCKNFPKNEDYAFCSPFTKAPTSIALSIAEGSSDTDKQLRTKNTNL
ncbi:four helix bundle protein [Cellulophaga sp. F20128]|uniref:four helix bundle protein n=1 Tax=Cellulophaga sp. F20128 TaxID=2926413 RepID=UPI001FF4925B|nr:four helix bundle protein [Cellulophaga sp. F20128]MCK0155702.1 four helix bundle protein [Cellulophaga sp. F20128]